MSREEPYKFNARTAAWRRAGALKLCARLAHRLKSSCRKPAMFDYSRQIASAVEDAHDDDFGIRREIIDGVAAGERDAQLGGELRTKWIAHGKPSHAIKDGSDLGDQLVGDVFGAFARDIRPDFGKIGFCRVG
jgi:hypothetical protein